MQQQREAQADGKDLATETLVRKTSQDINTKKQTVTCSFLFFCHYDYIGFDGPHFWSFFVCCFFCCIAWAWETIFIHENVMSRLELSLSKETTQNSEEITTWSAERSAGSACDIFGSCPRSFGWLRGTVQMHGDSTRSSWPYMEVS